MLLHQDFVKIAKQHKHKPAIVDRAIGKRLTYEKALIASLILAGKFNRYDHGFIGIMVPTSAGCALSILGALLSGRVPVMINYSTGAAENAKFAQEKCGFKTIITSKALLEKVNCPKIEGMVFLEEIMESVGAAEKIKAALKAKLPMSMLTRMIHGGAPDDNAVVLFTSGSEKEPKAVQLTHKNIYSNVCSLTKVFDMSSEDIFLANLPYFHVFGQTANLWVPLHLGMTIVTYVNPLEFKTICEIAREEKVTMMVGTPSFFWGYLAKSEPGDFSTVRIALAGADKCPDALRRAWMEKHDMPLLEAYGATETSPGITVNTPTDNRPGSVGRVLPGLQVKIEDLDTGEKLPPASVGKVLVKGDSVMKGYFDDLEETSLRMRGGWYDTGDMGYFDDDGYLWLAGRLKRFVKIGGEMISLVRVENVLEKVLPADVSCCVVEVPEALKGAKIVAAVTADVDHKKLLKQMAAELPNLALPKQFVVIEDLPTMGSGKIDFRLVTEMVREKLAPRPVARS